MLTPSPIGPKSQKSNSSIGNVNDNFNLTISMLILFEEGGDLGKELGKINEAQGGTGGGSIHSVEPPPFTCQHKQLNTERMPGVSVFQCVPVSVFVCVCYLTNVFGAVSVSLALPTFCESANHPPSTSYPPTSYPPTRNRPACLHVVCSLPAALKFSINQKISSQLHLPLLKFH